MRHKTKTGFMLAALALPVVGCAGADEAPTSESEHMGQVGLRLILDDASEVSSVQYSVTNSAGAEVSAGDVDVEGDDAVVNLQLGLPAGTDYTIVMSATTSTGIACSGWATFDVGAGQTTDVSVAIVCDSVNDGNDVGVVNIGATFQTGSAADCPDIASYAVSSLEAPVGGAIALSAAATDASASVSWSTTSGELADATAAATSFTCTEAGEATLTLTVAAPPACEDSATIAVQCVGDAGGDGGGDGGGSGGGEETTACADIVAACHEKDPHDGGPISQCHELAHHEDEAACVPEADACIALCEAAPVPSQAVSLQFAAKVGSEDFVCGQDYAGQGTASTTVTPLDFRFFVHNVRLVTEDGTQVPVALDDGSPWQSSELALLDFEDGQGLCFSGNTGTNSVVTGTVPGGAYTGVAFSIGVPASLNHGNPANFTAPLDNAPGMLWAWLSGHRFLKAEMLQNDGGAGQGLLHPGSTGCTGNPAQGTVSCARSNRPDILLTGFDPTANTIVADIGAMFAGLDLTQDTQCHSAGAEECADLFSTVGIEFATGEPLSTQTVFRVE